MIRKKWSAGSDQTFLTSSSGVSSSSHQLALIGQIIIPRSSSPNSTRTITSSSAASAMPTLRMPISFVVMW